MDKMEKEVESTKTTASHWSKDQWNRITCSLSTPYIFSSALPFSPLCEYVKWLNRRRFQLKSYSTWIALCSLKCTNHLFIAMAFVICRGELLGYSGLCIILSFQCAIAEIGVSRIHYCLKTVLCFHFTENLFHFRNQVFLILLYMLLFW